MNKVIAAIDNSSAWPPVLAMARAVATALGASVEVLHVLEDDDDIAGPLAQAVGVTVRTLSGDPVELLPLAAAEKDVVAVVLGTRGRPGRPRPARHLAMTLAGQTDKPVVVVPPGAHPPVRLHTAVVAMKGTSAKARALQRCIELSTRAGLEIVVVHVHDENDIPSFSDQVQHETEAYAQEFFARHLIGAPKTRLELRIGVPAVEVLDAVKSAHAELVAVGWSHTDDPNRGAVARAILDRSPVPILLVAVTT
ncbi:MAG TPA: universal stress protein [Acidimicrobiales bacterium]|nr:universal stress protein [Acidimicrobiales bacterium]